MWPRTALGRLAVRPGGLHEHHRHGQEHEAEASPAVTLEAGACGHLGQPSSGPPACHASTVAARMAAALAPARQGGTQGHHHHTLRSTLQEGTGGHVWPGSDRSGQVASSSCSTYRRGHRSAALRATLHEPAEGRPACPPAGRIDTPRARGKRALTASWLGSPRVPPEGCQAAKTDNVQRLGTRSRRVPSSPLQSDKLADSRDDRKMPSLTTPQRGCRGGRSIQRRSRFTLGSLAVEQNCF